MRHIWKNAEGVEVAWVPFPIVVRPSSPMSIETAKALLFDLAVAIAHAETETAARDAMEQAA